MQIKGSRILVLGGWGLVGSAICHKLMKYSPSKIIVSSLNKSEAEEAVKQLRNSYKKFNPQMFVPAWGNIFTRSEFKTLNWGEVLKDSKSRKIVIDDIFEELDNDILRKSALNSLIADHKPDIVIDCINTATAIAYQDVYNTTRAAKQAIEKRNLNEETVERLMASLYIPQLIRHTQILFRSLTDVGVTLYLKIGTSGTGGMGLNIPYTHSEERPSRVLLAKAAVAGAQSLLLFLMARTPDGPVIKEIKPAAAIAWKRIVYDQVIRKGKTIPLVDMSVKNAHSVRGTFKFDDYHGVQETKDVYKSVFIDTGENGIFSKGEFRAIGSLGQMEIITPEEIADYAVYEIIGGNTGHDMIQAFDAFTLGPTYRGGMLYNNAIKKIEELENEHKIESVAFEMLGPPRLSKLLFEANLIKKIAKSLDKASKYKPEELSKAAEKIIATNSQLRSEMISIGLVVLMADGKNYVRGKEVKIPVNLGQKEIVINPKNLDKWCNEGWIDLRPANFKKWTYYFKEIIKQAESVPKNDTSSRFSYNCEYWDNFKTIDEGKLAAWIFEFEDNGWRFKR